MAKGWADRVCRRKEEPCCDVSRGVMARMRHFTTRVAKQGYIEGVAEQRCDCACMQWRARARGRMRSTAVHNAWATGHACCSWRCAVEIVCGVENCCSANDKWVGSVDDPCMQRWNGRCARKLGPCTSSTSCRGIKRNGRDAPAREGDPNPTASTNQRVSRGS